VAPLAGRPRMATRGMRAVRDAVPRREEPTVKRFRVRCGCGTTTSYAHPGNDAIGRAADFTCYGCEKTVEFVVPPLAFDVAQVVRQSGKYESGDALLADAG